MENAVDALKMAAGVLVFVVALSISINAFGEARQTAQIILDNIDREYDYRYIDSSTDTERTVRGETIVPSIYKAYIENYKIIFKQQKNNGVLEEMEIYKRNGKSISSIDLGKEGLGTNEEKENFLKLLLGGTKGLTSLEDRTIIENFKAKGYDLPDEGLYAIIKGTSFIEKLGVYYEEELNEQYDTPTANRNKKKVITYIKVI